MASLRETVDRVCLERLGRKPDLENPAGYNDLIQWLKIHDQRPEHIICCDKWAVRDWVKERAGADVLIPASLDWPPKNFPCIAKCTHDSGSVRFLRTPIDVPRAALNLRKRMEKPYGIEKGEWAYQFVPRQIIVEDVLPGEIVDYKFHCGMGEVRWVQVIRDRKSGKPKETILSPLGNPTGLHMDQKMVHDPAAKVFPGAHAWVKLRELAKALASGWRYVRVDLYWSGGRALFGELTFWPLAGCYTTKDEPEFGSMLGLDLSCRYEPIAS